MSVWTLLLQASWTSVSGYWFPEHGLRISKVYLTVGGVTASVFKKSPEDSRINLFCLNSILAFSINHDSVSSAVKYSQTVLTSLMSMI